MYAQAELTGVQSECGVGRECKRCATQLHRIDAEEQMVHDGIAHDRQLENVRRVDQRFARHVRGE